MGKAPIWHGQISIALCHSTGLLHIPNCTVTSLSLLSPNPPVAIHHQDAFIADRLSRRSTFFASSFFFYVSHQHLGNCVASIFFASWVIAPTTSDSIRCKHQNPNRNNENGCRINHSFLCALTPDHCQLAHRVAWRHHQLRSVNLPSVLVQHTPLNPLHGSIAHAKHPRCQSVS